MKMNEYQEAAMQTCMLTSRNPLYMLLMIGEEAGELQGKLSKAIRKGNIEFNENDIEGKFTDEAISLEWFDLVKKEIGDVMWGIAGLCSVMGWKLEDIAQMNIDKLAARQAIGTIDGNGDGIVRGK